MKRHNNFKDGLMICICINLPSFYYRIQPNPHYSSIQSRMKDRVVLTFTVFQVLGGYITLNILNNIQLILKIKN